MARISIIVAFACKKLAASGIMPPMKYWEIVADKLSAPGGRGGLTGRGLAEKLFVLTARFAGYFGESQGTQDR